MDAIDEFIARYRKEFDFYEQAARLCAQLLDQTLQDAGIRAIVTSRAKGFTRLEEKVRQRNQKNPYHSVESIFQDIVDLAGVRVALYFPGERGQVGNTIIGLFDLESSPKQFPENSHQPTDKKRFSGYWATHYRVHLRDINLNDVQKRYRQALIEIQVASVLMHAWAEVEHDFVYKPQQGTLSDGEYAILDQINGMVIAGEIALEQLQQAGKQRVAEGKREFSNHYDLADYLLDQADILLKSQDPDALLGRINILFRLLSASNLATPDNLRPYLKALSADFERRPLADQIIDQLLAEDPSRYELYRQIREPEPAMRRAVGIQGQDDAETTQNAMGRFLSKWIEFENFIRSHLRDEGRYGWVPTARIINQAFQLSDRARAEIEFIRKFRNNLVHGIEIPAVTDIDDATKTLESILDDLRGQQTFE